MLLNLTLGLAVPWLFGIFILIKDRKIILTIFPVMSVISLIIVILGHYSGYWILEPNSKGIIAAIPYCLGLYPINACLLIYFIRRKKLHPYILIFIAAIITTIEEALGLLIDKVHYGNGWNIFWTFISYLLPYILNYLYYILLEKLSVFDKEKES